MQIKELLLNQQGVSRVLRCLGEVTFGLLCGGCAILLGLVFDAWATEVSTFALVYPLILIGTLYGQWTVGLAAGTVVFLWGWWHVLPPSGSLEIEIAAGPTLVTVHAGSALITLGFAIAFRRAMKAAFQERDDQITRGVMLIRELEHRTKNNFALVVGLLQAQKRKEDDARITGALDLARARIHSFARAYANLAESQGEGGAVAMKAYLREVVSHFCEGGFPGNVTVKVDALDFVLAREKAVGIGLFVNEALTNSAKHAFPDNRPGRVAVRLLRDGRGGWELTVEDDGVGFDPAQERLKAKGTGSRLMQAFAQQADATFTLVSSINGTRLGLTGQASPDESADLSHSAVAGAPSRRRHFRTAFAREYGSVGAPPARSSGRQGPGDARTAGTRS